MNARHDACLWRIAWLEYELFGAIVSASVKDYVEAWLAAQDVRSRAQFGGSRAFEGLR